MTCRRLPIAFMLATAAIGQVPCSPSWSANAFVPNGTNGTIAALAPFDDGSGPALYAGGTFTVAGGTVVNNVARWNGTSWSDVGGGTNGTIWALTVFDDGTGSRLYAAGAFTTAGTGAASHVARWNGTTWAPVGIGTSGTVYALATFGSGPTGVLIAGGTFGSAAVSLWSAAGGWVGLGALPGSTTSAVKALAVFDDGTGPALYAGGTFQPPPFGGNNIWKWTGAVWSVVGGGIVALSGGFFVNALVVHDDWTGPALYAGGQFSVAGGIAVANLAKWNGVSWSSVGGGVNGAVTGLASFDDGSGPALYASGFISRAGATPAAGIARFSGGTWSAAGSGINGQAYACAAFNDGSGAALFVAGGFSRAGGLPASNVARLSLAGWSSLGPDLGVTNTVNALVVHDDGTGPHLFAGGMFTTASLTGATNVAKLGASGWVPIAAGIDGPILALAVFDDGGGPALYAGGYFTTIGSVAAASIAKWNGTTWSPLGSGLGSGTASAMAVFDDGTGPALYVGGLFFHAGGVSGASFVARWNGTAWSAIGPVAANGGVSALTVLDDGGGRALFAGGDFTSIGAVSANRVARWNGATWSPVGAGVGGTVSSLAEYPASSGPPRLVAGGDFVQAAGSPASHIAIWNGASWAALGLGVDDRVTALRAFDDGAGPVLYAGGNFANAGGSPASRLARWNGAAWSAAGDVAGPAFQSSWVRSFAVLDSGSGPALHAGGQFSSVGGVASLSVARRVAGGAPVVRTTLLPQIVYPGGSVTMSVEASGSYGIAYQWRKNGIAIPGATGPSLTIAAAAAADAGSYGVAASNGCGSGSSNAASLAVIAGLATFGTATAGCAGFPFIGASSASQLGNASFGIWMANAPPNASGLCAASGAALSSSIWVSGLAAWIDPGSSFLVLIPVASDAGGNCFVPAGLPQDPSLVGFTACVQGAWTDPCGPLGLSATNAFAVTVVP